ncbi:MAG TPA: hypothetical protein VM694_14095 [Polyangium sp.]|nr:hypothetical protein [Polyangium sp.]
MALSPRRIEIHIEELVLDGVAPDQRRAVGEALQRELEGLVARHGVEALLSRPAGAMPQSPLPVTMAQGARPEQLGAQVARAVHRGWR